MLQWHSRSWLMASRFAWSFTLTWSRISGRVGPYNWRDSGPRSRAGAVGSSSRDSSQAQRDEGNAQRQNYPQASPQQGRPNAVPRRGESRGFGRRAGRGNWRSTPLDGRLGRGKGRLVGALPLFRCGLRLREGSKASPNRSWQPHCRGDKCCSQRHCGRQSERRPSHDVVIIARLSALRQRWHVIGF